MSFAVLGKVRSSIGSGAIAASEIQPTVPVVFSSVQQTAVFAPVPDILSA